MNILTVSHIYKMYDGAPLLNDLTFEVKSGEILCLLGRSGSGKSTLLRIIAGLEEPDRGDVLWNGVSVLGIPTHLRNFGLMFQDYALFPHRNVAENVSFGLEMKKLGSGEIKKTVQELLERVNMKSFAERSVAELSGGEQQRVALARALAANPRLLMLDEPLAALDRSLRLELQEELHTVLHQAGIPVIYVTHDQEEAVILGDTLAILHEGVIVQNGTPQQVYATPANRWVAEFLGMKNFIRGKVMIKEPNAVHTVIGDFTFLPEGGISLLPGSPVTLMIKSTGASVTSHTAEKNSITGIVRSCAFREDGYLVNIKSGLTDELEFILPDRVETETTLHLAIPPTAIVCLRD